MSDKQVLVPRLRFPEFREAGVWKTCNLGGGSPRPIDGFITKESSGLNWLKIGDVDKEAKYVTRTQERVIAEALGKTREVYPGDLILSNSMSFGRPYLMKIKTCIHDGWIAIREIHNSLEGEYLYYFIFSSASQAYFLDNAAGSGVLNLNADIIKSLPISYPARDEQQKIADCLSSLDNLIAAQAEKIDALKSHKRGLMQQLFPREGETVPRLRFPEFRDAAEWEERSISEIGEVVTGSTPSTTDKSLYGGKVMFVSPADISDQCFVTKTAKTLTDKGLSKARVIPTRSILFVCIGSTIGKVAQNKYECATNQQINSVIPFNKFLNNFVYYALELASERIAEMAGKQAVPIINKSLFSTAPLEVPDDKGEQQAVSDCLSSLDALIAAHTEKLQALKAHKQGLMQQLFPIGEGVA
jgi:type I restriction enzyme S subunit